MRGHTAEQCCAKPGQCQSRYPHSKETTMTEHANSPKARKFEQLARESHERAESYKKEKGVDDSDPVFRYLENSAAQWERRAREIQQKADRRARRREVAR